jgi:hypothetical protein
MNCLLVLVFAIRILAIINVIYPMKPPEDPYFNGETLGQ